jgi:hypothetical protein
MRADIRTKPIGGATPLQERSGSDYGFFRHFLSRLEL